MQISYPKPIGEQCVSFFFWNWSNSLLFLKRSWITTAQHKHPARNSSDAYRKRFCGIHSELSVSMESLVVSTSSRSWDSTRILVLTVLSCFSWSCSRWKTSSMERCIVLVELVIIFAATEITLRWRSSKRDTRVRSSSAAAHSSVVITRSHDVARSTHSAHLWESEWVTQMMSCRMHPEQQRIFGENVWRAPHSPRAAVVLLRPIRLWCS